MIATWGKQSRRRHALVDRLRGKRRGVYRFAVPTAGLGTDVAAHEEARRDEVELLADLLADLLQVLPAVGTGMGDEIVPNLDTGQRIGQRPALGRLLRQRLLLASLLPATDSRRASTWAISASSSHSTRRAVRPRASRRSCRSASVAGAQLEGDLLDACGLLLDERLAVPELVALSGQSLLQRFEFVVR